MKKLTILPIILLLSYNTFSQDCSKQHFLVAKSTLINVIGIDNYNLKQKGDKILSLEFICDTLGNVLLISKYQILDKNLSKKQFNLFCKKFLKSKMDICNPEPEIANSDYFRINQYKPKYSLLLKVI
jgi:hypothetical protein